MTRIRIALAVMAALLGAFGASSAATAPQPTIVTPANVKWIAGTGAEKGTYYASLYGDPRKAGAQYTYLLKVPAGMKLAPHVHAVLEQVSIVSGTFAVGVGRTWDSKKMVVLGPGSFAAIPANVPHYAMAKTTTVLEIHGIGPETMTMLKPGKM